MSENDRVPTKIVELLIANINELSKQVQRMPEKSAKDVEILTKAITKIIDKLNTPPRHEELDEKLDGIEIKIDKNDEDLNEKIDEKIIEKGLNEIKESINDNLIIKIKWMIRSVWIVFSLIAFTFFIASLFIDYSNKSVIEEFKKECVKIEQSINQK